MDPHEARRYTGFNVHFNPQLNPKESELPQNHHHHHHHHHHHQPHPHWWNKIPTNTQPIKIQRQSSTSSDTSSPCGSPITGTPPIQSNIGPTDQGSKQHMPVPNVYKQFNFNQ